jgi:hypothetical protein
VDDISEEYIAFDPKGDGDINIRKTELPSNYMA